MQTHNRIIIKALVSSVVFLGLMISCSKSYKRAKNSLEEMNIRGNVKSLRETIYYAVEKFGEIEKGGKSMSFYTLFNNRGNITLSDSSGRKSNYRYGNKGNLLEKKIYAYDNKGVFSDTIIYSYANEGNLIYMKHTDLGSGNIDTSTYKYDDRKNLIEKNTYKYNNKGKPVGGYGDNRGSLIPLYSVSQKSAYKYDDKGNCIEEINYNSKHSFYDKSTYTYDNRGKMIEMKHYFDQRGRLNDKSVYKYDNNGNIIEMKSQYYYFDTYLNERSDYNKFSYRYDNRGNMVEMRHYNLEKGINDISTYKYEFDSHNNWVKKIEYRQELPREITEREIEYYR